MKYYYNNVPGKGLCRNNLIYTSLINEDKTEFCMWFNNDTDYHKGQNEVVDPALMDMKFRREKDFLLLLDVDHKEMIPNMTRIDSEEKKIYFEIQGDDFWEQSHGKKYEDVVPRWQEEMLYMLETHKKLGIYKYSLHPSSYWVIDGELRFNSNLWDGIPELLEFNEESANFLHIYSPHDQIKNETEASNIINSLNKTNKSN